jgi:hypothetical protein
MSGPGALYRVWQIECGACGRIDQPPGRTRAAIEQHLREVDGWRRTAARGWVCRRCWADGDRGAGEEAADGGDGRH